MTANTAFDFPWLRRIRVHFTGLACGQSKIYESTGRPDALRIVANITETVMGVPAPTSIAVYNLSGDTRRSFVRNKTKIMVEAGWDNGPNPGLSICYQGELLGATSYRSRTEIITVVSSIPAIEALSSAWFCYSTCSGATIPELLERIVKTIEGVNANTPIIKGIPGRIGEGGWAFAGLARNALDELARQYRFSWSIINDRFQAIGDDACFGGGPTIRDPYLISVNPLVAGPLQYARGVQWRGAFNPLLDPGSNAFLQSEISPEYNREYRVHTISHHLDCYSPHGFITDVTAGIMEGK